MKHSRLLGVPALLVAAACSKHAPANTNASPAAAAATRITLSGSSALAPLASEAATRFMRLHPEITVQVTAGGSRQGLSQVSSGAVTIGNSDIAAAPGQAGSLEDHRVAVVGFAAMANRGPFDEAVASLTRDQMRAIFGGQVRNWTQVGGGEQVITVINRARSSGTRAVFGSLVLGGDNFAEGTAEQDNNGQLQTMLLQQTGAISYLALSYRSDRLKVFALDGVEPTTANIASGAYPVWSYEHMYTRGPATGALRQFLDFVISAEFQADAVSRLGFIPITQMRVSRDHD